MTDTVERLRSLDGTFDITTILDWAHEAADEIERLQRLVGDMLHAQHKQERTNILQEAEIERLKGKTP